VNRCVKYITIANIAINPTMTTHKVLYMLALNMRDAFGPVSHVRLRNNLSQMEFHQMIVDVMLNCYDDINVEIMAINHAKNNK
jgi:hypothetical protein